MESMFSLGMGLGLGEGLLQTVSSFLTFVGSASDNWWIFTNLSLQIYTMAMIKGGDSVCVCVREREREREYLQILLGNIVERLWSLKAIEGRGCCNCISTHVVKVDIVSKIQLRKDCITDFVQTIACWAPKTCWKEPFRRRGLLKQKSIINV